MITKERNVLAYINPLIADLCYNISVGSWHEVLIILPQTWQQLKCDFNSSSFFISVDRNMCERVFLNVILNFELIIQILKIPLIF